MSKVKCRYCGKEINKETSYAVKHGKRNWYYCSFEHSNLTNDEQSFYREVRQIINTTHTVFYKEMKEIANVHGYKKMLSYIREEKRVIEQYMQKNFTCEYAKVRYFSAILKNNLADYSIPVEHEEQIVTQENDIIDTTKFKAEEIVGLDSLLDGLI